MTGTVYPVNAESVKVMVYVKSLIQYATDPVHWIRKCVLTVLFNIGWIQKYKYHFWLWVEGNIIEAQKCNNS